MPATLPHQSFVMLLSMALLIMPTMADESAAPAKDAAKEQDVYCFPFFRRNGGTGVYLALSRDGMQFTSVNKDQPIMTPPPWEHQNLMRDPSIVFRDGVFHMVWTSNWAGPFMGYASSRDLKTWSEPLEIRPHPEEAQPKNIWAPELQYDPVHEDFFIVFSSTLPAELNDGDGSEDPHGNDHRLYVIRTKDFKTFSPAELFFDPQYSVIDGQLCYDDRDTPNKADDRWVMVYKNELGKERGGKNLRLAFRDAKLESDWEIIPTPIVGPGSQVRANEFAEGPALLKDGKRWRLYWDAFSNGHYSAAESTDLETWRDMTDRLRMPPHHPRHGTPFKAPLSAIAPEYAQVLSKTETP